jgi:O-succinylbenzoic acid--CoA ligase
MPSQRWTYGQLDAALAATQARLQTQGVEPGARVALHLDRGSRAVLLLWALWRGGAVAVPLSTRLPPREVGRQAQQVGAVVLITDASDVGAVAPDELAVRPPDELVETGGERGAEAPFPRAHPPDRPATIVFTSGSTGAPKAALHTWENHLYSAKGANANLPLRPGDRWLLSLPLYHVGGLAVLVRCALAGAAVAVPDSASALDEALRTAEPTHVSLVATQFRRLLDAVDGPPSSTLRAVLLGGGPIPDDLLRRGHERGWPLLTTYGCTEMASQVTTTAPGAPLDELRTAGRRLPHRRLRVEEGQILVAGPPLFRGYVTDEGLHDPRTGEGWYPTGDRGRIDASGRLHVLGRMDRMFVSGGENVQPEEVETALECFDEIERAVVVAVPDDEYGHRPVAYLQATSPLRPAALRDALGDSLPAFKIPDVFRSLPEEATGEGRNVDREYLRNQARMLQERHNPQTEES